MILGKERIRHESPPSFVHQGKSCPSSCGGLEDMCISTLQYMFMGGSKKERGGGEMEGRGLCSDLPVQQRLGDCDVRPGHGGRCMLKWPCPRKRHCISSSTDTDNTHHHHQHAHSHFFFSLSTSVDARGTAPTQLSTGHYFWSSSILSVCAMEEREKVVRG